MTTTQTPTLAPGAVDIDLLAAAVASSSDLRIFHGPQPVDTVPHWCRAYVDVAATRPLRDGGLVDFAVTVYDNGRCSWWPGVGELREEVVRDTDEAMDLLYRVLVEVGD